MLIIAGVAAIWLYSAPKSNSISDKILFWVKRFCRFAAFFLILLLLLSPVLKFFSHEEEKPILLFYLDDSQSIKSVDSVAAAQFHQQWEQFADKLSPDFEVHKFFFSNDVKDSFSGFFGKRTNLSAPAQYTRSVFNRKNTGAVIVASDGIANVGNNPVYESLGTDIAVFTMGLGDTSQRKDVLIKEVNHNSLVFLNNAFNILVNIQSYGFEGRTMKVSLIQAEKELGSQNINITSANDYKVVEFVVNAEKPGYQRYTVKVSPLDGEQTLTNNQKDFYVEVIDGREKILVVYQSPHPDVNAIASALAQNKNFEVISKPAQNTEASDLKEVSLIVGHQFPSGNAKDARLMSDIRSKKMAFWEIVGAQSPVDRLSDFFPEMRIQRRGNSWNDAQPNLNPHFNAFSFSEKLIEQSPDWPPVIAPFGQYSTQSKLDVLAYQTVNKIKTDYPLIAFSENEGVKTGWTFGEGMWRWRMTDFARNNSPELFDELVNKIARFLMVKEDKRRFRVYPVKNEFEEDESVKLQGELFVRNFEPITDAEIMITLTNEQGKDFSYRMSRSASANGYELDAGNFEAGYYTFKAEVTGRPEFEKIKGGFLIKPVQIELTQLKADFSVLREWSAKTEGKFFYKNQFDALEKAIRNDMRIKPLIKTKTKIQELVKIKYILLLIALLLSIEWFIRKWEGGY
ncbi:MAG: hypothetical protein J5I91_09355 [Bacteroidetes bacterium]|nr:hypothetical protein [Bacteroidota bacterium]